MSVTKGHTVDTTRHCHGAGAPVVCWGVYEIELICDVCRVAEGI